MDHTLASRMATEALIDAPDFGLKVISPKDKKWFKYRTADVNSRFFMETRSLDLMEVESDEKA